MITTMGGTSRSPPCLPPVGVVAVAQAMVRAPVAIGTIVGVGVQAQEVAMAMALGLVGLQQGMGGGLDLDMDLDQGLGPGLGPVMVMGLEVMEHTAVVMGLELALELLEAAPKAVAALLAQPMMGTEWVCEIACTLSVFVLHCSKMMAYCMSV